MDKEWRLQENNALVYYNDLVYNVEQLIKMAYEQGPQYIHETGIINCTAHNVLEQLVVMIFGLLEERPVYFNENDNIFSIEDDGGVLIKKNVFLIASTSGTTGRKKYLPKENSQWLQSFKPYSDLFGITGDACLFINGSLAYTANLYSVLHLLNLGGEIVLSDAKNPKRWIEIIENHKCSIAYLVPSKLRLLNSAIGKRWTQSIEVMTAGEALSVKILEALYKKCPHMKVHHYYGAAELGHISAIRHEDLRMRPTSVGRAFPGVEIEIREDKVFGRSPYSFSGGDLYDSAYDYGWIDDQGYLYIKGRRDTQINVYGRKFDARISVDILRSHDEVEDCLFVKLRDFKGKGRTLDISKDTYGLYVICTEGQKRRNYQEIFWNFLQRELPKWQQPTKIIVVDEALYSDSGKYDMVNIRALFSNTYKEVDMF